MVPCAGLAAETVGLERLVDARSVMVIVDVALDATWKWVTVACADWAGSPTPA